MDWPILLFVGVIVIALVAMVVAEDDERDVGAGARFDPPSDRGKVDA